MAFIDVLNLLLSERKVSRNKFCADLHIGKNSVAHWENRGNSPDGEILAKIAAYFNVSTDYLLGIEKPDTPVGEQPVDEKRALLIEKIRQMSDEDFDMTLDYVEAREAAKEARSKQNRTNR